MNYLFTAYFADGLVYKQNPENLSTRFEGRSCFTDVLDEQSKGNALVCFELSDGQNTYSADLTNGQIQIKTPSSFAILVAPSEPLQNFRPIYWIENVINLGQTMQVLSRGVRCFKLGWQANTQEGKNVQQVIEIF
jgi:hypothetical protein